jgi:hypothetical protein
MARSFPMMEAIFYRQKRWISAFEKLNWVRIVFFSLTNTIMARASIEIIQVLRQTALHLEQSNNYQWGHMGLCNCGFLAQEITHLQKQDIHTAAMQGCGNWSEQLNDYCPHSGLPMDHVIAQMLHLGFDTDDLKHLEKLSDRRILEQFPLAQRNLHHNAKADVVNYIRRWADLLESELIEHVMLPSFISNEATIL